MMSADDITSEHMPPDWPTIFEARCRCGWWLSEVRACLQSHNLDDGTFEAEGVVGVAGICKRHGQVEAVSFEVWP